MTSTGLTWAYDLLLADSKIFMHSALLFLISFLFLGCSATGVPQPLTHEYGCASNIYSLKSAECLEEESFIQKIEPYPVIFLGDHHGSKNLHLHIAKIIRLLHKKGYRIHLANEWFTPKQNPILQEYAKGEITDEAFQKKIKWDSKKAFSFDTFSPIYHAIIDTKGKLYGINLTKEERKLISDAHTNTMSKELLHFYNTLDLDVNVHKKYLSGFFTHCHTKKKTETQEECFERMYRVQVAWDSYMARQSAKIAHNVLKKKKEKLIIFAGASHVAHEIGINLRFARESTLPYITIIPQHKDLNSVVHKEADFLFIYQQTQEEKKLEKKLRDKLKKRDKEQ